MKYKRGMELELSGWWILAIVGLALFIVLFVDVREAWGSAIGYVKNFLRFGR